MRRFVTILWLFFLAGALSSCTAISDTAKMQLQKPPNCSSARADIDSLNRLKASKMKERMAFISLISPFGLLMNFITHDIDDRAEVANGQYNRRIDDRIATISYQCGM